MAREALGVVGAAAGFVVSGGNPLGAQIGFAIGGTTGAQIGFAIGSSVGAYIDPVKVPHPGLSDAPTQTSRDGVPIPIIHGLHYCHGNIIQKNPEEIVTTTSRQGKGGSTEVEEKSRFRSFAIGICRGPIAEVTRIWENNKLVYDARTSPAIPAAETAKYLEGITIYKGGEDQLPDAELEAHWGADNTPAYRGLAYIVWNNKDLTDTGGAIPQYAFEVNGSRDATITSKPYPIEAIDGVDVVAVTASLRPYHHEPEGIEVTHLPLDGFIGAALTAYEDWPPEGIDVTHLPLDASIRVALKQYLDWPPEGIDVTHLPLDASIRVALLSYTNWPAEGIDVTHTPLDGSLT